MYLRTPILPLNGRKIRILLYARYSTEEQDASSIPDQYAYCQRSLSEADVKGIETDKLADPEMSGELVWRPGIDIVRQGIANRQWDLIICEDSSRLFRNVAPCLELVGSAVDKGIRVIAINDDVDTWDTEHWEERLTEALNHHARSNRFTSRRIKRKHEALWDAGAAIGLLKPAYRRQPSIPARMGEPARGPFFDEVDPNWSPVIHEAYERIYRGEPAWGVAAWLTKMGLPKCSNQHKKEWTDYNVIGLIQRPDYRGFQIFRATVSEKHHGTGRHPQKTNPDPNKVMTRDAPHLRIVPDWLWYAANTVIEQRTVGNGKRPCGLDHSLAGVPRDARGPLSTIFFCGICGAIGPQVDDVSRIPMLVDLFDPSNGPKYGLQAFALKVQGLTLEKIGHELGVSKRSAHIAAECGKAMTEARISDPFIELTERPTSASRWR